MDPDKSADDISLSIRRESRIAMLEQALGRLERTVSAPARPHPRWRREHNLLLAAATCGVATCAAYILFMLTGISPFDTGMAADDDTLPQSTRRLLVVGEIAFFGLFASWGVWAVVRRG